MEDTCVPMTHWHNIISSYPSYGIPLLVLRFLKGHKQPEYILGKRKTKTLEAKEQTGLAFVPLRKRVKFHQVKLPLK